MDFMDVVMTRRSVRRFDPGKKPAAGDAVRLLKCAMSAPSAHNRRPWEFLAVSEPEMLVKITRIHPYCKFLPDAGLGIVVCADLDKQHRASDGAGYWMLDCAAAAENILLAARNFGLGACWCGIYPDKERMAAFSKLLSLPENVAPFCLIAVGNPLSEQGEAKGRFEPEKIHCERW